MANRLPPNTLDPRERVYGTLLSTCGAIGWFLIAMIMLDLLTKRPAILATYVAYLVGFLVFGLLSALFFRAYVYGHYVLVGPAQFPLLHQAVVDGAARLGMSKAPATFVYNSNGVVNAFAQRVLGRPFVFLTSALVEVETEAQVRFVIGHELGHHAAGHLNPVRKLLRAPGHLVPFLGRAYSRRRELTCDRVGAFLSEDLEACRSALGMLACGCQKLNASLNCDAFAAQEALVPGVFGWLSLVLSRYPRTTQRVIAISQYFRRPAA
ncbi:MAG: M48 family metallopeptidase [Janthinobacterium lividum]